MRFIKIIYILQDVISKHFAAFLLILFHGIILGLFLQKMLIKIFNISFLNPILVLSLVFSTCFFISFWIAYSLFITRFIFGEFSRGSMHKLLTYDSLTYLPLSISIIVGFLIFNLYLPFYSVEMFSIGLSVVLVFLFKFAIYKIRPVDKNTYLAEKAQQTKNKHVNTVTNLNPDSVISEKIGGEQGKLIRKYIVRDELRNAINLKDINKGEITIKHKTSETISYSIGWDTKNQKNNGHLKLFISYGKNKETIFDKSAKLLLTGWNEYLFPQKNKENTYTLSWEHTIDQDLYLSINFYDKKQKDKKNIIVIVFDGVHKQTIGLYQNKPTNDHISKFFKDSWIYTNAYSQGEWTMPNFALMATGLYQSHHGVTDPDLYSKEMPQDHPTLAEIMQKNGYNTFGYVGHNRVSPGYGHARGFNRFIYRLTYDESTQNYISWKRGKYDTDVKISDSRKIGHDNKDITLNAISFLRRNTDTNNFLFLHYFDTHQPFFQISNNQSSTNDALYNENIQDVLFKKQLNEKDLQFLRELYMQKFYEVDENISLLFDYIEKYEDENTTVIFTTDHGTVLFDKETTSMLSPGKGGRENYLTKSIMSVPLLIRFPNKINRKKTVIDDLIEANISIMPTVLDIAGISPPKKIDGKSIIKKEKNKTIGKGYALAESCYKDRYELFIQTSKYGYFLKTRRDRQTNQIFLEPNIETFFDSNNNLIKEDNKIKEIKNEINNILKENNLHNLENSKT